MFTQYLRVVDQGGVNVTTALLGKNYVEGNLGYLRSTTVADRMGGTLRLIFPVNNKIAFTPEGGVNETLLGRANWETCARACSSETSSGPRSC